MRLPPCTMPGHGVLACLLRTCGTNKARRSQPRKVAMHLHPNPHHRSSSFFEFQYNPHTHPTPHQCSGSFLNSKTMSSGGAPGQQAPSPRMCQSWPRPARPASQGCACRAPTRMLGQRLAARARAACARCACNLCAPRNLLGAHRVRIQFG